MHSRACGEQAAAAVRPRWEVADIFRLCGESYRRLTRLPASQIKIMRLIEMCRTAALGGHLDRCDACGYEKPAYNSCRNRHCPKCQTLAKEKWLEARERELLPTGYFHNVFTLPHELNPLILSNKKLLLNVLFQSVAATLQAFAHDPKWKLGGQLGFMAVLHTWNQTLMDHFHLHCLIPAGALCAERTRWVSLQGQFLFPVAALSITFRGKFLARLKKLYNDGELVLVGRTAHLQAAEAFDELLGTLYTKKWCVYSKRPMSGPRQVLDYLARYTHRVAISNERIKDVARENVTFSYKDRSDQNRTKRMTLSAHEFIRRFLLHALPENFMRVRHFGFLANVAKKQTIGLIREALGHCRELPEKISSSLRELMLKLTDIDLMRCPRCGERAMCTVGALPRISGGHDPPTPRAI